jgi:hypothetical protein
MKMTSVFNLHCQAEALREPILALGGPARAYGRHQLEAVLGASDRPGGGPRKPGEVPITDLRPPQRPS